MAGNDRQITVRLSADASDARKRLKELEKKSDETFDRVTEAVSKPNPALERFNQKMGRTGETAEDASKKARRSIGQIAQTVKRQEPEVARLSTELDRLQGRRRELASLSDEDALKLVGTDQITALERLDTEIADVSGRVDRLNRRSTRAGRIMDNLANAGRDAASSLFSVQGAATAAAGAGLAAGGLALVVNRAAESASEIQRLSRQAQTGVEDFQEISAAFREFNINQEQLAEGLREGALRLDEFATTGSGPAAEAFQRIGIEADEAGRFVNDTDKLLLTVIERVRRLDDEAAQVRVLDEIFGDEAGQRFIQVLETSQTEIARLRQEAREMGLVIDAENIRQGDRLNEKLRTLGTVIDTQVTAAVTELGPQITSFLDEILDRLPEATNEVEQFGQTLGLLDDISESARIDQIKDQIAELREEAEQIQQGGLLFGLRDDIEGFATAGEFAEKTTAKIKALRQEMAVLQAPMLDAASAGDTLSNRLADLNPNLARTVEINPEVNDTARNAAEGMGVFGGAIEPLPDDLRETITEMERLTDRQRALAAVQSDQAPQPTDPNGARDARAADRIDDLRISMETAADASELVGDALEGVGDSADEAGEQAQGLAREIESATDGAGSAIQEALAR